MRVLLVDDHRLLLEGLTNLLGSMGIQVVGTARDGWEAVARARELRPDVTLMDIRMPNCSGLDATRLIRAEMPDARVVILTTSADDADLFEAVKSGACGYLLKTTSAAELVEALEQAQRGVPPFSPGLAARLLDEFTRLAQHHAAEPPPPAAPAAVPREAGTEGGTDRSPDLTPRQREVLVLVASGLTYKEVGSRLGLSPRTIKYHMSEIMAAIHVEHRAQVLAYAGRMGLMR